MLINIFKNSKFKITILLIFLLFIYTSICAISYAQNISTNIANSVFRLHVIANSDSSEDQNLKYIVRDNLLNYMNKLCKNCSSKEEAIKLVNDNKNLFKEIAINTIKENGYSYNVNITVGNFEFPTKNYGDISLPAGYYDALKVEIGQAKGQNWWCVMFPPLCFVDISSGIVPEDSKKQLQNSLSDEEFSLISDNSDSGFQLKFKLLEFFNSNGLITAKK